MEISLFGLKVFSTEDKSKQLGQLDVEQTGATVTTKAVAKLLEFDYISSSEVDLINSYRRISYMTEVSSAIDKIINEVVIQDDENPTVEVDTSRAVDEKLISDEISNKIEEEFKEVVKLLDFNNSAYQKVREWYIDGKIVFQKIIDPKRPKLGVQRLVQLDPRKMRRIQIVDEDVEGLLKLEDEFYVYTTELPNPEDQQAVSSTLRMTSADYDLYRKNILFKIKKDAIVYVDSGLIDRGSGINYGYLHKAVKIANQLDLVETSLIIYRLARSSERRAIYVDPGNLPPSKAREVLESVKNDFRNKTFYDSVRGTIEDKSRVLSLQEDYFMLRRNGKNTEIETLQGGENLGNIEDVLYFRDKLFNSLNVPLSRFKDANSVFSNRSEIARDEMEFFQFIVRLRGQFSQVFYDILKTQLILKRIVSEEDWELVKDAITFRYNKDNFWAELKELEIIERRHSALETVKPYIGIYYSNKWVRTTVLGQTQEEIDLEDKQIKAEKNDFASRINPFTNQDGDVISSGGYDGDSVQ